MKWSLIIKIGLAVLVFFALPFLLGGEAFRIASADSQALLRLYLMTCAFVGALWAVYLREGRLRANSDNVLVSLVIFVIATMLIVLSLIVRLIVPASSLAGAPSSPMDIAIAVLVLFSLEVYFVAFFTLLWTVFMKTYNQLYNLRTNKAFKYFKPIHYIRTALKPYKSYEFEMTPRSVPNPQSDLFGHFVDADLERLKRGASILLTGAICDATIDRVISWLAERLTSGETVNYVVCDRPAIEIWTKAENAGCNNFLKDFVIVDAYSPSFGFSDDIHERNKGKLNDKGVKWLTARTFAGLHSATNKAFNIIKDAEQKQEKNIRRPMVMVYAHVSALCDFESIEQFRVFWRHVIPSERSYGMVTVIIEDSCAGPEVIDFMRQVSDFVFRIEIDDSVDPKLVRMDKRKW